MASSGRCVSAHTPAAAAKPVPNRTSRRLRADQAMTRAIICARGAGLRIEMRIDQRHGTGKSLARQCARPDDHLRPETDPREVALGDVKEYPDEAMVGDPEQHDAGRGAHAVDGVALEDFAVLR